MEEERLKYTLSIACRQKDVFTVVKLQIFITDSQVWVFRINHYDGKQAFRVAQ